jgi:hypothetical protein
MLTELLAFLDELLAYLESVHDIREEGKPARRSPAVEPSPRRHGPCVTRYRRSVSEALTRSGALVPNRNWLITRVGLCWGMSASARC